MQQLLIKNARLEVGFIDEVGEPTKTETKQFDILISDGEITKIAKEIKEEEVALIYDAKGKLLLPSFREMHIHVDKTYFSGPWKAPKPIVNGILTRIEEETELLPVQLELAEERAKNVIAHYIEQGHTHIRSHCNIDPNIGLKNLEATVNAFKAFEGQVTYDIVAFPQHGLLRSEVERLMREAMKNGATLVGGVDPATIDRNISLSLETMFDIANEAETGLDLHLHDPDSLGEFTFYKLIELTRRYGLEGKVTISHGMALGDLTGEALENMMAELAEAQIDVTTTIPISRPTIPVLQLDKSGVEVSVGHDSLTDHWSPFGTGNTVEKLGTLGERFRVTDERGLHHVLKFATGGITPLNDEGVQVWPKVGSKANLILVDASCTAEMVARRKDVCAVISDGKLVHENEKGCASNE